LNIGNGKGKKGIEEKRGEEEDEGKGEEEEKSIIIV
jgi:hypothetical protein